MYENDRPFIVRFCLSWRIIPVIILLLVFAPIIAFFAFQKVTENTWREAYEAIEVPDGVTFHTDLIAWQNGEPLDANTSRPSYNISLREAEERIARWTRLRERLETELNADPRWAGIVDDLKTRFADLSGEEQIEMEAILVEHKGILDEVRELALVGAPARPLDFSKGSSMDISHLAPMRNMARLLKVSAKVRFYQRNTSAGLTDIKCSLELADAIAPEPILINQLVRHAICMITLRTMQFDLKPDSLSQIEIDTLFARLRASSHRDRFAQAFWGDVLMLNVEFTKMNANPNALGAKFTEEDLKEIPEEERDGLSFYGSFLGTPLRSMDRELNFTLLIRIAEANHNVYYQAHPELIEIEQTLDNAPKSRRMTKIILPAFLRASQAQSRLEAQIDLVQLGILAERYKVDHGHYSDSLDAFEDAFGGEVPPDPFTGEPYRYSVEDGNLLLYSIGPNLKDDGGRHDYKQGDIVWRGES